MIRGKVWKFGDNINTDLMMPVHALFKPRAKQKRFLFEANRPGWVDEVATGDLIVGGTNYGTGSSRPAPRVLKDAGLAGIVAESFSSLFFRNCVNFAFPALAVPGVAAEFEEGDEISFDLANAEVENTRTGKVLKGKVWAPELIKIIHAGGLVEQLQSENLLVEKDEAAA
jgi:3-isopropylmalate/(R)-2-methylmalate dehydratase small subunit